MHTPDRHAVDHDLPHADGGNGPGGHLLSGNHRGSLVPSVTGVTGLTSAVHRVPATTIGRTVRVVEAAVDGSRGRELGIAGALSLLALALNVLLLLVELLVQVLVQLGVVDAHLLEPGNVLVVLGGIELESPPGLEDGNGSGLLQIAGEIVSALGVVDALDEAKVNDVLASVSGGALRAKVSACDEGTRDGMVNTFFRPV